MISEKFRALALGLCVVGSGAIFQEIEPTAKVQDYVIVKGEHRITDLIDQVSTFTGRNYIYEVKAMSRNPNSVVTLQHDIRVTQDSCEAVFNQLLYSKGLAVITRNPAMKLYEIIDMAGPKRSELANGAQWMSPEDVLKIRFTYTQVLTSVKLKHINAITATTALRPFFSTSNRGGGLIPGNVGNGSSLLLQGFAPSVAQAIMLLEKVDLPATPLQDSLQKRLHKIEKRLSSLERKN